MITRDGPLWLVLLSVSAGASMGACSRWWLSYRLNSAGAWLPLGTLTANILGGFLCGVAMAAFAAMPALPPWVRLFLITGLLGGLTTFSTFSGEVFALFNTGAVFRGAALALLHVTGSVTALALGWWLTTTVLGRA